MLIDDLIHAVAGHLRRIFPAHSQMGVSGRGKNYKAILEIEPHFRGDRSRGENLVPNGVVSGRVTFVSEREANSAARIFSCSVYASAKPETRQSPRVVIGRNACQVRRKHASAPRQLALAQPDFENSRNPVSTIKRGMVQFAASERRN